MSKSLPRSIALLLVALLAACSVQAPPTSSPQPTQSPAPATATLPTAAPSLPPTAPPTPAPTNPSPSTAPPSATPSTEASPTTQPTPSGPPGTPIPIESPVPDTGLAADLADRLQAAIDAQREQRNIPGIGAAVIFPDRSIWASGSGNASLLSGDGVSGDTLFVVGSITKTFIAAAVMQLADEGRLSLDDPIASWLPDYPRAGVITVRQLLNHRSGIYNYFEHPDYDVQVFATRRGHSWTPQEILDTFVREPYFEPGSGYHYSNTNFILLGLIIEEITGQTVGSVLDERFFAPAGLADTHFQGEGPPPVTDAATGYLLRVAGFREVDDATDYLPTVSAATVAWAAGAIAGSARDMASWGDALYGGHLVSPAALAQMEDWTYYPATDETYGLGTRSREFDGERMFGHTGSIRGYAAAMWHFKQTGMTIVALTNRGRIDANPVIDALAEVAHPAALGFASAPAARGSAVASSVNAASEAADEAPRLRAILDQQRVALRIPGASATVIFPDGSVWKAGSGNAKLVPNTKATGKTPFVSGSITKTFVAAAVMQLAEEGRLSIDDALARWLPDYPRADQITLRHLLSHTSGVFNYFEHPSYNQRVFKTDKGRSWTAQEILDEFDRPPYFAPGGGYHYSNTGYVLLGLVLEQETGQPIGQVLRQRFFGPLGLGRTYFQGDGPPPASSAHGYLYSSGTWHEWSDETGYRPTISAATVAWAAGGLVSSAPNVARWCAALYGGDILSDASLLEMTGTDYSNGGTKGYGLGTYMRISNGRPTVGHTGSLRGFNAAMWYFPESDLTVVVTTNLGRFNTNGLIDALAAEALD